MNNQLKHIYRFMEDHEIKPTEKILLVDVYLVNKMWVEFTMNLVKYPGTTTGNIKMIVDFNEAIEREYKVLEFRRSFNELLNEDQT